MRLSLRARIFVACLLVGSGSSVFFGLLAVGLLEAMEYEQIDLVLDDELSRFAAEHVRDPAVPPPHTSFIQAWAVPVGEPERLPSWLQALPPGMTEVSDDETERRVAVRDLGDWRYVVALDLTLTEPWEDRAFGAVIVLVVLSCLLSGLLGRWLAARVVGPVGRLARQASAAGPGEGQVRFDSGTGDDEMGLLANALQDYSARLEAYAVREREFASQVSHELRTPLAVLASSVELSLATERLPARARASLQRAATAASGLADVLDALMALGRVQAGAAPDADVDLARVTRRVVDDTLALRDEDRQRVRLDLEPGPPLHAPPGAVQMVIRNLLDNALIHAAGETVEVTLRGGTLEVRDHGSGIHPRDRERVFDPFYRGDGAAPGAGLGLAIVRRLCEHRGWVLSVDSRPGEGTRARVDFVAVPDAGDVA